MLTQAIRELRAALGDSVEQFAERVGVTDQTVRNWENGARSPNSNAVLRRLHLLALRVRREQARTPSP